MSQSFKDLQTFEGAPENELKLTQAALKNNRFLELPEDYIDFLEKANGGIYQDVEFYGTREHIIKERFFTMSDIVDVNKRFRDHSFLFNRVIVGQDSQSFFIYDGQQKIYLICDRMSFQVFQAINSFDELLSFLMV